MLMSSTLSLIRFILLLTIPSIIVYVILIPLLKTKTKTKKPSDPYEELLKVFESLPITFSWGFLKLAISLRDALYTEVFMHSKELSKELFLSKVEGDILRSTLDLFHENFYNFILYNMFEHPGIVERVFHEIDEQYRGTFFELKGLFVESEEERQFEFKRMEDVANIFHDYRGA